MLKVIRYKAIWFTVSGLVVAGCLVLLFAWGLKPGIEFRGGTLSELEFDKPISAQALREGLSQKGFSNVIVQPVSEKVAIVKTEQLSDKEAARFKEVIGEQFGASKELRFESIGPSISGELVRRAYWQVGLVVLGILLYVAYAFRKTGNQAKNAVVTSWRMGAAAILALVHDITITVGLFVILGKFRGVEIDSLFITALLTILGFSVHDTIVVFDRIRENLQKYQYKSLVSIIDYSVNSTLARSINTTSTLIFVLVAMLLLGGTTIHYFVLALLVGVTVGTYSSIFVASPLLYLWSKAKS